MRPVLLATIFWMCQGALLILSVGYVARLFGAADGLFEANGRPLGRDFVVFWTVAVLASDGQLLAGLYDPAHYQAQAAALFSREIPLYVWVHPPPMLLVVLPLGLAPYLWALGAWSVAGLLAYWLAARRHALLLLAPAVSINLLTGQAGLLLGALFLGALRLLGQRPVLAGVCVGCLAVKPHLGLMLPVALLAARAWRAIAAAAITVAGLAAVSGALFGWDAWREWLLTALPARTAMMADVPGPSITVSAFTAARLLDWPVWAAWLAQAPLTLLAASATWWTWSRTRRGLASDETAHAVLLLAACLATPTMFSYDLVLAAPVALWGLARWQRRVRAAAGGTAHLRDLGEPALWAMVWMLPLATLFLNHRGLPIASPVLAAALGMTVWQARYPPEAARA